MLPVLVLVDTGDGASRECWTVFGLGGTGVSLNTLGNDAAGCTETGLSTFSFTLGSDAGLHLLEVGLVAVLAGPLALELGCVQSFRHGS